MTVEPDWLDKQACPFASGTIDLDVGRMRYVAQSRATCSRSSAFVSTNVFIFTPVPPYAA